MKNLQLKQLISGLLLICILISNNALKAGEGSGKVEGLIFTHFSYNLSEDAEKTDEFENKRAYFGYKYKYNDNLLARVLIDVGRLESGGALVGYLKYGYLEWKGLISKTTIYFGLHGMNQWKFQEKFWGYRYIFKSFQDQNKWGSSADLGVTAKFAPSEIVKFYLTVRNGEGYKKPQDAYGKNRYAIGTELHPLKSLSAYIYFDTMPVQDLEQQQTMAGFLGYKIGKKCRVGAEYNLQNNQKGVKDNNLTGLSAYATCIFTEKFEIFGRFDRLSSKDDWNKSKDGDTIIAGIQVVLTKGVRISPNLQLFIPKADGAKNVTKAYINVELKI
jgi:hypothetical protein